MSNKIIFTNSKLLLNDNDNDIVFCYGHFNLIHPGHIRYLQHARTLANRLVVVLTSDAELDFRQGKSHFSEKERAESVANLQIVDNVIVLNEFTLEKLIKTIKPKVLLLGKEFERQHSEQIALAISAEKQYGKVVFHAGETHYASSNLFHANAEDIESGSIKKFNTICKNYNLTLNKLQKRLQSFSNSKILVIGDTIIDNYVACDALGMSAEAPVLVVKELENREFIGGAAIVASHVKALGAECHYISLIGKDNEAKIVSEALKKQDINLDLFVDGSRPTTYKTRYMVENQKLFRVSKIKEHKVSKNLEKKIIEKLIKLAPNIDGILVSDFVYGTITINILETIKKLSKKFGIKLYGDIQCSSQVGKITQFTGFDLITPTEKEARIALDDNESGIEWVANKLLERTKSKNLLVKLGANGFIAYGNDKFQDRQDFPALTVNPVDVTGAGDSLIAVMSVCLSSGSSLFEASLIGSCMASLAVKEVGNKPISNSKLSAYIEQIIK